MRGRQAGCVVQWGAYSCGSQPYGWLDAGMCGLYGIALAVTICAAPTVVELTTLQCLQHAPTMADRYSLSDADVADVEQQLAELAAAKGICLEGAAAPPVANGSAAATSEAAAEAKCGVSGSAGTAELVEPAPVAESLPGGLDIMGE